MNTRILVVAAMAAHVAYLPVVSFPVEPMRLPAPTIPGEERIQHPLRLPPVALPELTPVRALAAAVSSAESPKPAAASKAAPAPQAAPAAAPPAAPPSSGRKPEDPDKLAANLGAIFDNSKPVKPTPVVVESSRRYRTPESELEEALGLPYPSDR